jgi:RNA polymerase-binding transcription factor DksA
MAKKELSMAAVNSQNTAEVSGNSIIDRLSASLAQSADALQNIITSRSSPMEGAHSSDKLDQAAESSALDVQRAEAERAMETLARIHNIQRLIADGWKGTCTAKKPEGGSCGVQIPFARLEGALGTTVCIGCAGGGHRKLSHYR